MMSNLQLVAPGRYQCPKCRRVFPLTVKEAAGAVFHQCVTQSASQPGVPDLPCLHRGPVTRSIECELCDGNKRIVPAYACNLHGECALSRTKSGSRGEVRQCLTCADRTEPVTFQPIRQGSLRWAVGITTAPRKQPTLARTLASLKAAGWDEVHVFAEPGVEQLPGCTWHQNPTRLSGWPNFVQASRVLSALDCDAVLLVQDDVLFAPGLREYLESTPWPKCGALSPYTAALYTNREAWGWRPVKYNGLVGALAFVIRPQVLRQLAAHPYAKKQQNNGIDTLFGKWIAKHGGLQFHHPSLCQHIGDTSTIHGRASNSGNRHSDSYVGGIDLSKIVRPPVEASEPRIGLVGWNTASGLGSCNRDAARNLPISRWLVPTHDRFPTLGPVSDCEIIRSRRHDDSAMRRFLLGLDAVLFFEIPYYRGLVETARAFGVRTVGVAMAECLPPGARGWPMQVDTLICPTWDCYRQVAHVVKRSRYLPWPVDTERFRFTPRTRCERFIFAQGTGGGSDRKGGQIVAAAARLAPEVPIVVYSQMDDPRMKIKYHKTTWPPHIDLRGPVQDETTIYDAGDVSIQPSRYEGLGLSLLEAQACGLPLVTTDGEPMREYRPLRTIYSTQRTTVVQRATVAYDASPRHLADTMRELLGQDISAASLAARRYIEQERSWAARREEVLDVLLGRERAPVTPSVTHRKALATFGVGAHASLLNVSLPTFRAYTERHGYDLCVMPCESEGRPPAWGKVKALRNLLERYGEVLWIDADALIADDAEDLSACVPPDALQALVEHPTDRGPVPNTGVWFVRRGMVSWLDRIWERESRVDHPWWEQAAMADLLGYGLDGMRTAGPVEATELGRVTHYLQQAWNVYAGNAAQVGRPKIRHALGAASKKVGLVTAMLRA